MLNGDPDDTAPREFFGELVDVLVEVEDVLDNVDDVAV